MRTLYRSDQEYKQHSQAIESIANQYHYKNSDIRVIYENVLSDLEKTAKCRQFLSVLTMRHVKSILHESAPAQQDDPTPQ
jgi:hypothetical protein